MIKSTVIFANDDIFLKKTPAKLTGVFCVKLLFLFLDLVELCVKIEELFLGEVDVH